MDLRQCMKSDRNCSSPERKKLSVDFASVWDAKGQQSRGKPHQRVAKHRGFQCR